MRQFNVVKQPGGYPGGDDVGQFGMDIAAGAPSSWAVPASSTARLHPSTTVQQADAAPPMWGSATRFLDAAANGGTTRGLLGHLGDFFHRGAHTWQPVTEQKRGGMDEVKRRFGYLFDGTEFFMHAGRYPAEGYLCLEDGSKGLHIVWLAAEQNESVKSTSMPLDDITGLYAGRTAPSMKDRPWLGGDADLFFTVTSRDACWDLEAKKVDDRELWLACLSSLVKLRPVRAPPAMPPPLPNGSLPPKHLNEDSGGVEMQSVLLAGAEMPPPLRHQGSKMTLRPEMKREGSELALQQKPEGFSSISMEKHMADLTAGITTAMKEMAQVHGQALMEAVRNEHSQHEKKKAAKGKHPKLKWYERAINWIMPHMDRKPMMVIATIATLWAIFGVDVYISAGGEKSGDTAVYSITFIIFVWFVMELGIQSLGKPGYWLSFFFWLDFIAAISLLPEVFLLFGIHVLPGGQLSLARAGRAARAGTRAARLARIVKLLSLVGFGKKKNKMGQDKTASLKKEPSKIGTKMGDLISQKVIVIVALMLVISTFSDLIASPYVPSLTWDLGHMEQLDNFNQLYCENNTAAFDPIQCVASERYFNDYVRNFTITWDSTLRKLAVHGKVLYGLPGDQSYGDLRDPEDLLQQKTEGGSQIVLDYGASSRAASVANIVQVLFVILILCVSSILFSKDTERLVIAPLEGMTNFVNSIVKNPLMNVAQDKGVSDETHFVASAIKKFLKLLQIALGDAGASIMSANLGSGGHMTAVVPGRKVRMIFGFCDIRNFTDCTECLQEDVMVFVNTIAKIVHYACKENEGSPNKNIGDAFLLAWSLPDTKKKIPLPPPPVSDKLAEDLEDLPSTAPAIAVTRQTRRMKKKKKKAAEAPPPVERRRNKPIADHALRCFLRVINEATVDQNLKELTDRPALQARLPGYMTKMGFGLHVGWAIEGAIGSELKIDASYLSPHVNMAARLEAATKQYGVAILMTESFWSLLSPQTRACCRRLDRVTVKGSAQPISLYTYDVQPRDPATYIPVGSKKPLSIREFYAANPPRLNAAWRGLFGRAVESYIEGNWEDAAAKLVECQKKYRDSHVEEALDRTLILNRDNPPTDKPCEVLLEFMRSYNLKRPEKWDGFRELTEK